MSDLLSREQVECYLTDLVQDKIDGVRVAQLLDTDAALRAENEHHAVRRETWVKVAKSFDKKFFATDKRLDNTRDYRVDEFYAWCRAQAENERLTQEKLVESASCFLCGYNGPAYAHPDSHPCAAAYRDAQEGRL
jgi:hypothetical protein